MSGKNFTDAQVWIEERVIQMKRKGKVCRLLVAAGSEKGLTAILSSLRSLHVPEELQIRQAFTMTQVRQKAFPAAGADPAEILIVVMPLKDDSGIDHLLDIACKNRRVQILLLVGQDIYDQVSYHCRNLPLFVLSLPVKRQILTEAVRFMISVRRQLEERDEEMMRLRKNLSEIGIISRAKCLLIQKRGMTEEEAHYFLEKEAMDRHLSKRETAVEIIEREKDK